MTAKIGILKINLTRTIRIAYNTLTVFIKPFNRTSMESKPSFQFDGMLLIEGSGIDARIFF